MLVTVARVDEVPPGTVKAVTAGDEPIALANCDGSFYATQGKCLHLEGPLGEGKLDDGCLLMPLARLDVRRPDGQERFRPRHRAPHVRGAGRGRRGQGRRLTSTAASL